MKTEAPARVCPTCGLDPERPFDKMRGEEPHRTSSDALDELHLRRGAENVSVDVTRAGRVSMNRIRLTTGMTLSEQVRSALDLWLPRQHGPRRSSR